ncbi:hypothetical protein GJ744_004034 [Endocarpon pusillum]|uniref:Uncharacterized protein n=1 Tax=Endocarpon pusillum TaxID=364733 RepID=A0A8H7E1R4_9EURO|nr:hypothetical protein GJ744_004034 [Endocarpon pusillum]
MSTVEIRLFPGHAFSDQPASSLTATCWSLGHHSPPHTLNTSPMISCHTHLLLTQHYGQTRGRRNAKALSGEGLYTQYGSPNRAAKKSFSEHGARLLAVLITVNLFRMSSRQTLNGRDRWIGEWMQADKQARKAPWTDERTKPIENQN